ncbi:MAG TPA: hypothetical protein PKY82_26360 [Pyrinomonadaceae bacterium]|nr:hypothetical protein [Pyrinomonadaceae bacterium]
MSNKLAGIFVSLFVLSVFTFNVLGQQYNLTNLQFNNSAEAKNLKASQPQSSAENNSVSNNRFYAFPNPILENSDRGCSFGNLNIARFDNNISQSQRIEFCEALQAISTKLNSNWSPELRNEINQIWQVFLTQNVKIRPMKAGLSGRVMAAAEAFTERSNNFNASFYLRPEKLNDKSFFLVFMHELRHVYDFYTLWATKSKMTEAELEKRGFRIMGKIYQEMPNKDRFFRLPTFWDNDWKNLSTDEIARRREEKINNWMRGNDFYKDLMKNPEQHSVGFSNQPVIQNAVFNSVEEDADDKANKGEKLPTRLNIRQSNAEIPQNVKELSFQTAKAADQKNPDELLKAALINEKNLYRKMDNFVYDQNLQLQCWKKQQVDESFSLNRMIARTNNGEALYQGQQTQTSAKPAPLPKCILNMESIKTDVTETFWATPYLDQMPIKFEFFTELDGIPVARYTVLQPSMQKFNEIASQYSNIKPFKTFVGTIFVSLADAQIIKFWGTSFPEATNTNNQKARTYASYCATAIRQKLSSGIWVTTLLNTVAVTNDNNKMKPFSYVVKYQNYRQGETDVKILDDNETAVN